MNFNTYTDARSAIAHIEAQHKKAGEQWRAIEGIGTGAMGLTPDSVKQSPAYRAAQANFNFWHNRLKAANTQFLRQYKSEYYAERRAARNALQNNGSKLP